MKYQDILHNIKASEMYTRIASGAFWSILGTSVSKFVVLVAGIICANILGPKGYGELGIVRSTVNMFVIFGTAGMGVTATKYIAQYLKSDRNQIGKIYKISNYFTHISGLLVSFVIILFSSRISTMLNEPNLCFSIKFGGFLLFFSVINSCFHGTLVGFENFKGVAVNTFISSAIEAFMAILGAKFWGVPGALIGFGIGIMTLTFLNKKEVNKLFDSIEVNPKCSKIRVSDFKVLYQFSLPAALSSFIVVPSYWVARAILAKNAGFAEVGMYEAAEQWRTVVLFIPSALSNIILPMLSGYQISNDFNAYKKAFTINLSLNVSISVIVSAIVVFASKLILSTYGSGFDNTLTFITLICSCIFSSFANVVGVSIISKGKVWQGLCFNILWSFIFIGFSMLFIKNGMGSLGLSFGCLIAYFLHSIFQLVYLFSLQDK